MPDFAVVTAFKATDRLSPAFNRMGAAADKFGDRASRSFHRVGAASGAAMGMIRGLLPVIGAATVLKFANDSIEAWNTQAVAIANVEAGLASTNNAIGLTSKQLQDMASRWQNVGLFGDETILQNVTAQLLTFGSIGKQNFDKMQGAAMDITAKLYGAAASGEQLRDVTIMLGKAMDNPIKGMTALRRRGIQFTDAQEKMIETMQKTQGREVAQAYLLKEIATLYGGVNEALAKTDKGMEIAARNKLGDTMEIIGKILVPLKQTLLDIAVEVLPIFTDLLQMSVKWFKLLKVPLMAAAIGFVAYKIAIFGATAAQAAMNIIGWIKYLWMMREFIMKATTAQWLWNVALNANPIGIVIALVGILAYAAYDLYKNWDKYLLLIQLKFKEWEFSFLAIKAQVYELLSAMGMVSKQSAKMADIKARISYTEGKILTDKYNQMQSPNQARESNRQSIDFQGNLNISGAPNGSTVSSKTRGAPPINMNLVGAQ